MDIRVEIFKLNGIIKPREFFEYKVIGKGEVENFHQQCGRAKYSLSSNNSFKPVFKKGDELLYSLEELSCIPNLDKCCIEPCGYKTLTLEDNLDIYSQLVTQYINLNLRGKKDKYKVKYNNEIHNSLVRSRDGKYIKIKSESGISVERVFNISPTVTVSGDVLLTCSIEHKFDIDKTIYDLMKEGKEVTDLKVDYTWTNITGSTGKVVQVLNETIVDKLEDLKGQSLVEFFVNNNQSYRVNSFTEEDKKAHVVMIGKGGKKPYAYIPQSLKPLIDRDKIRSIDPEFSIAIDKYIKMEMDYRFSVLEDFLNDIGVIKELGNLKFECNSNNVGNIGFSYKTIPYPIIKCNKKQIDKKHFVFNYGYYAKPKKKINVGVMFPQGSENETRTAIRRIWDFNTIGEVKDDNEKKHKVGIPKLLDLEFNKKVWCSYPIGDITEYKRIALELKEKGDIDLILCVIPNEEVEEENPYNPFKRILAQLRIPSQMVSLNSIKSINLCRVNRSIFEYGGLYYIHNIALGMLAKTGGTPWVLENITGDIDCFVGLDVGNPAKGIRYPSCSIVFDKCGTLINYFKPELPQQGEIIVDEILQDIFDKVLISFKSKYGHYPKHLVIHRDGFSRENIDWYKNYFDGKGIKFDIIEVKKQGGIKFGERVENYNFNPTQGSYITNGEVAYLVTTSISPNQEEKKSRGYFGSSRPLKIQKTYGDTSLEELVKQVYYLSEIHVGSTKSTRLPITTGYADRISKLIHVIPAGEVSNRLFFL